MGRIIHFASSELLEDAGNVWTESASWRAEVRCAVSALVPPPKIKTRFFLILAFAYIPSAADNLNKLSAPVRSRQKGIFKRNKNRELVRAISSSDLRFRKCNCSMDSSRFFFTEIFREKLRLPSMSSPWRNDGILWPTSIFSGPLSDGILRTSEINFERDDVNLTTKIKYEDEIIETR